MQTDITAAPGKPAPVHLSAELAKANARAAYLAHTLQMQQSDVDRGCRYLSEDGKCRCAIGASLTEDDARRFDKLGLGGGSAEIMGLIDRGYITTDDPVYLRRLQTLHDGRHHADFRHLVGITEVAA